MDVLSVALGCLQVFFLVHQFTRNKVGWNTFAILIHFILWDKAKQTIFIIFKTMKIENEINKMKNEWDGEGRFTVATPEEGKKI